MVIIRGQRQVDTVFFEIPEAPILESFTAPSADELNLRWSKPGYVGRTPILLYEVELSSPDDGGFSTVNLDVDSQSISAYTEDHRPLYRLAHAASLVAGKNYQARVRAVNGVGASAWLTASLFFT